MAMSKSKAEERAARLKAAQEAQAKAVRKQNLVRGGIAALVLVVLVGVILFVVSKSRNDNPDEALATASGSYSLLVGPDTAPHKIVVYEDFLCPICQAFEEAGHAELAQAAADGKVQLDYRPYDLLGGGDKDSYSARAAAAFSVVLAKSGAEVAKKYHDLLYETGTQPSESGPFPDNNALLALAVKAGADESAVKDDILNDTGNDWVVGATAAAEKAKISGTPTIFLDGKRFRDGSTWPEIAANLVKAVSAT